MSSHTPGPWVTDGEGIVWSAGNQSYGGWIADCRNGSQDANANLIAAAPDLLAALERYVAWADSTSTKAGEVKAMRAQMNAAIAAAKGQA